MKTQRAIIGSGSGNQIIQKEITAPARAQVRIKVSSSFLLGESQPQKRLAPACPSQTVAMIFASRVRGRCG